MGSVALIAPKGSGKVEKLAEMRNRLPPDLYAEFAASLFKLASAAPKLQNPLALTTEEKKETFKRNTNPSERTQLSYRKDDRGSACRVSLFYKRYHVCGGDHKEPC